MKAGPAINRRNRILIFYSLAMLIPGLVLGYLAYRGILNDQALREKQTRQEMESVSREFFANLDSLFNLQVKLDQDSLIKKDDQSFLLSFTNTTGQRKRIIQHKLLYLPADQLEPQARNENSPDQWIKGWELEYKGANLKDAYDFYKRIALTETLPESKFKALVAMARIRNKQEKSSEAIQLYREIAQTYASYKLNGQIPANALALSEIAAINSRLHDASALKSTIDELTDCLIHPKTGYNKSQYQFFKDLASEYRNSHDPDSLGKLLDIKQLQTEQLLRIFAESDMLGNNSLNAAFHRKFIFQDNFNVAYNTSLSASGENCNVVLDLISWMNKNRDRIFSVLNREKNIYWKIAGTQPLASFTNNGDMPADWLAFSFPENLPPWKLQLATRNIGWLATLFQPGNGVFVLIFTFIILIMLMGLAFTIHILNQEMRLNKLKTEFISNVSHELKSPLTSMRQMTEMLHEKRIDSEDQRDDYYSIMLDQSEHLSHLIDNILDFSRMEEHRKLYHFEPLDLVPVIEKMTDNFRRQFSENGYEFQLKSDTHHILAMADKEAFRQVYYNLIDNAIKYSGNSRKIEISLALQGDLCISIRDFGIGIERKDLDKIFDRFYRSEESQKLGIKGSGIGLTLVKRIVEAHEGRVKVESQPGKGTVIYIYLPVYKEGINEKDTSD